MSQRRRARQLPLDWTVTASEPAASQSTPSAVTAVVTPVTEGPFTTAEIDELEGLIGDAIDSVLDDFRDRLMREGKPLTIGAYRALVERVVEHAAWGTISLLDDDEYLGFLGGWVTIIDKPPA